MARNRRLEYFCGHKCSRDDKRILLWFALAAGIFGFFLLLLQLGISADAANVNEELEGSVETTCKITQMDSIPCRVGDRSGRKLSASAYVDICSPYFNKTISWKGGIGLADDCYKIDEDSGLPKSFSGQIIVWPCRANCEKELWYTQDDPEEAFVTMMVIGSLLLIFSLLIFYFYLYLSTVWDRGYLRRGQYAHTCAMFCSFTVFSNCWIIWFLRHEGCCDNMEEINRDQVFEKSQTAESKRSSNSQNNRLIAAIQGDWTNDDGLLISVKDRQATFLPSGNFYNLTLGEPSQVSILIEGQFWKLVNFDTMKLESDPFFAKQIWWMCESNGMRPDQKMRWSRREREPQDLPPSYEGTYDVSSGYGDVAELCVSAPPPAYENATVYDVTALDVAGVKEKWRPKSQPI